MRDDCGGEGALVVETRACGSDENLLLTRFGPIRTQHCHLVRKTEDSIM